MSRVLLMADERKPVLSGTTTAAATAPPPAAVQTLAPLVQGGHPVHLLIQQQIQLMSTHLTLLSAVHHVPVAAPARTATEPTTPTTPTTPAPASPPPAPATAVIAPVHTPHSRPPPITAQGATRDPASFALPANATEQAFAAIWARLLDGIPVGRHDNFFNLGGHSLLAVRAVQEMHRATGEKIAVRRLIFESLSQIAAAVESAPRPAASGDSLSAAVHAVPPAANALSDLSMTTVRFGHAEPSLYGVLHPASSRPARARAVLLCNPFGQEAVRIHRFFRVLADDLAGAGVACLRFDYHASGESLGDDHEADLDRWVRDVLAADAHLRQRTGVQEVDWLAPRLAGALAVRASAQAPQRPGQLVLWEPVVWGARYVDHLLAVHASVVADLPDGGKLAGDEEILGFGASRRLLQQMRAIAPTDYQRAQARRVLMIAPHRQTTDANDWLTALHGRGVAVQRQTLNLDFDWTSEEAFNTALVPAEALNLLAAALKADPLE
jgi:hypothetical protein